MSERCPTCDAEMESFPVYDVTGDKPEYVGDEMECPREWKH